MNSGRLDVLGTGAEGGAVYQLSSGVLDSLEHVYARPHKVRWDQMAMNRSRNGDKFRTPILTPCRSVTPITTDNQPVLRIDSQTIYVG